MLETSSYLIRIIQWRATTFNFNELYVLYSTYMKHSNYKFNLK